MPLRLNLLERVLSRLNILPVPLFDTPLAPGIAKVLVTACEMGIFDALSKQPLTLDALAEQLHCHPQGLKLLLQLLVSAGYLRKRHNGTATARWRGAGSLATPNSMWHRTLSIVQISWRSGITCRMSCAITSQPCVCPTTRMQESRKCRRLSLAITPV